MEKKKVPSVINDMPHTPGVYLFKKSDGTIVYIGKAKDLYDRVRSYFLNTHNDWKIAGLLSEYATVETIKTNTEVEALLLEAELIGQHKPKYNTLLKEGNPFLYIEVIEDVVSELHIVRNKKKKGLYFGPFLHKKDVRATVTFLKNTFQLNRCNKKIPNGCLQYHIGTCAGSCRPDFDLDAYNFRFTLAVNVLKQDHKAFVSTVQEKIKEYSKMLEYEKARNLNNYLANVESIFATIKTKFSLEKYADQLVNAFIPTHVKAAIPADIAIQIQQFLGYETPIVTIDCFDISHFQGHQIVGSCVRFTNGKPDKNYFRRFMVKTIEQQNDYAALQEIVSRRYTLANDLPDLLLIDGGKGQLSAVRTVLPDACIISLAKKEEIVFGSGMPEGVHLDMHHPIGKLLVALRDYAHHFAISYHRLKRKKTIFEN